jgi:hypothetical protein
MNYLWNLLEATSQWLNALLGGNPNITVSANAYLKREKNPLRYKLINKLFWWQEDHCRDSWVSDIIFARQALFELEVPKREPAIGIVNGSGENIG